MTKRPLRVVKKRALTDRITEFTLADPQGQALPGWTAGAHIRVDVADGDRAYSLIAWDDARDAPKHYTIAVQREDGGAGGSRHMHGLAEGGEVQAFAPKCDFPVIPGEPAVLLAGGIGITPMISMAAALKAQGVEATLHYTGRSRGAMAYCDDLLDLMGDAVHIHCDDEASALDLDRVVDSLGDRHLYICGPKGLMDATRSRAEAAGIPIDRVHVELFDNGSAGRDDDAAFEVELASTGEVFTIPPGKSIIEVLEEGGHDLIYDCQRGDCGICQAEVISGEPDHRDVVLSDAEKSGGKLMQICVSRAKSARLVLDL
ncbi:PDR/VanB family oxidoreductase [Lutimaribacter sp. EGI FJ00015]|uniref:PDR/VanB family oxidoreductase n=1 Tax=Lutimaribacter degradans TaxID=2945989 RepID=A0ACC5ZZA8_9RHOB|nr:PDR/VanB family oxidoreductase [Lutimaribacter sp. EGI FJ00013]MCM2563165.1 PDR/VanB family oxidoreductase [Lutimaribacter sp. EGI FJ00013]MCO0614344.1 PDR/VanB family oxidoreductase [Lutimaribacter sp. EGI FJ00015]MCO0637154.1 PDR/VanB family oxidoreductase [Lutimaribacter sp. EGI FJ00014]